MARCHHCGTGKFGLVRHRLLTLSGFLVFCSNRCKDDHRKQQQQEVRKKDFAKWLYPAKSTD